MRITITILAFIGLGTGTLMAQSRPLHSAALLELESIFYNYSDVQTTREFFMSEDGPVEYLGLSFDLLPQTTVSAFADGNNMVLFGYFLSSDLNPSRFLRAMEQKDYVTWLYEEDEDGDVSYTDFFDWSGSREQKEYQINLAILSLIEDVSPHLQLTPSEDVEEELTHLEIDDCVDWIEQSMAMMPPEFRREITPVAYCRCVAQKMEDDPELVRAALNPTSPEALSMMYSCFDDFIPRWKELGLSYEMFAGAIAENQSEIDNEVRKMFTRTCVDEIVSIPTWRDSDISYSQVENYCDCMLEKMKVDDWRSIEDVNDIVDLVAVELAGECIGELGLSPAGWNEGKFATGCSGEQRIPLSWNGAGFMVKLKLGESTKYILLDSGASEVVISRDWFNQLLKDGTIRQTDFEGSQWLQLADGSLTNIERYNVSSLSIGECTFEGFSIGVIDNGGMLCGMGLLGLFDSWTIDVKNNELILKN